MKEDLMNDLRNEELTIEQVFQKHYIASETFYFASRKNDEYSIKHTIAKNLNIYINDIYIIGSAKTGFSIKPKAIWRKFDSIYEETNRLSDKSDIDIAIVNNRLFNQINDILFDYTLSYSRDWNKNTYYDNTDYSEFEVSLKYIFLEYLARGWYRPDFAPVDFQIQLTEAPLYTKIDMLGRREKRKFSYAIYKDWKYFVKYQSDYLSQLRSRIIKGEVL